MKTSDLENEIKTMLATTQSLHRLNDGKKQITCVICANTDYKIGVLAEKLQMTRTGLAEHLLEKATTIAWDAAGIEKVTEKASEYSGGSTTLLETEQKVKGMNSMTSSGDLFSRVNCINTVFQHLSLEPGIAKESQAISVSRDRSTSICCLTSKDHDLKKENLSDAHFWFTIYEKQLDKIQQAENAYVVFGCGTTSQIIMVEAHEFRAWTDELPPYTQGKTGWHVQIWKIGGRLELRREGRGRSPIDVTKFVI